MDPELKLPLPGGGNPGGGGAGNCADIRAQIRELTATIQGLNNDLAHTSDQQQKADLIRGIQIANQELSYLQQQAILACPPPPPRRQTIRILLVTDGSGSHVASFSPEDKSDVDAKNGVDYFGLSEVIRTLSAGTPLFYFQITKGHRNMDPGFNSPSFQLLSPGDQLLFKPDYQQFSFLSLDLTQFDEIWLIAVGSPYGSPPEANWLTDQEKAALAQFMDGGGGIFATGDHENLGLPLCGELPRVRSMRKWWLATDTSYPGHPRLQSAPPAPSGIDVDRVDTLRSGHSDPAASGGVPVLWFDNQSDDIPQQITPTMYSVLNPVTGTFSLQPHPLLSSTAGPITVLPDHMHEGEVILPWNPTLNGANDPSLAFAGANFVEYPAGSDGNPVMPQIVATGQVFAHITATSEYHAVDPNNSVATPRTGVGLIGAYDGRQTVKRVGRVVVDSTWHHFFDINLIGDPLAAIDPQTHPPSAAKSEGFLASNTGQGVLSQIQTYYLNIAVWIARASTHAQAWKTAIHFLSQTQPLNMLVNPESENDAQHIMQIGAIARQALSRVASPLMEVDWLRAHLAGSQSQSLGLEYDHRIVVEAVMGAAVPAAAKALHQKQELEAEARQALLDTAATDGLARGLSVLSEQIERRSSALRVFRDALAASQPSQKPAI